MNNLVPVQLPEASLIDLGWNLALNAIIAITAWHYSSRAKKKVLREI